MSKIIKKTFLILLSLFIIPINAYAYSEYIYPGGDNIGIELSTSGVMVVGTYKINDIYPANDAGIQVGDIITSIDDNKITTIDEMVKKINNATNDEIKIGYMRSNMEKYTNLKLYKERDVFKTGLYVKDSISGIGTLTYVDPNTHIFGALGHEILENQSGQKLEIKSGKIYTSSVTGIEPSRGGSPGEKNAKYNSSNVLGKVYENTIHGVFGNYNSELSTRKLYKVATPDIIKKGNAQILTVLKNNEIESFDINIIKINNNASQTTKNLLFEINDKKLLDITGGIVQGMSGSPIIQGDYIIGAVTHVVVDNPQKGYGIFITNMLEESEN